ncbi:MauE/DoxX family redox-associated membrane protein [Streptomyces sp. NPDC047043]|uniref:MauE/DoxX family redox-associated membrane protein n=1 Tax=Streptomyces sp. NPDC047043 TaxID=3154497 RepID=UPI0033D64087
MILVSGLLGLVLIVAALPKLRTAAAFGKTVEAYGLLPGRLAHAVGRTLPWAELVTGATLLTGPLWRTAATAAALMFVAFTAGLTVNLMRGRTDLSCGCFAFGAVDGAAERIGWFHAARAAALAGLATTVAVLGVPATDTEDRLVQLVVAAGLVGVGVLAAEVRTVLTGPSDGMDSVLSRARSTLREVR